MDAKEAIFEAMGWAEDKKPTDMPGQMMLPGMGNPQTPKITQPKLPGTKTWSSKAGKPKSSTAGASHAAKYPGSFGNPDCMSKNPEGCFKHQTGIYANVGSPYGFKDEASKNAAIEEAKSKGTYKGEPVGEESQRETSEKSPEALESPQKVEVDGKTLEVKDQTQAAAAAILKDIQENPNFSEDQKMAAREAIENLQKKLAENAAQVPVKTEEQITAEQGQGAVQQTSAEEPASEEPAAETQEPAKEGAEETVSEEQIEDIDFSEPEESPKEEAPAEEAAKTNALAGIKEKKDWTPKQKKALERLAARFGDAVNGIKSSVGTEKFDALLNKVSHYQEVQEKFNTLKDPSESRDSVDKSLTEVMGDDEVKTFDDLVVDQIDKLLAMDVLVNKAISASIKSSLEYDKGTLLYWYSTFAERQKAHEHFRKLCDKYGLDELLESGEGRTGASVQGYLEDGDENHRTGGVVSSNNEYPNWNVNINAIADEKEGNGSVNNPDEIKEKIRDDLAKKNFPADIDDITETNYISTTDFTFKFPKDMKVTKSVISDLKQEIARNFPLAEDKNLSINYNERTDTLTVSVENDNKGYVSQKRLLQSKEFQEAVKRGDMAVALGLDDKGNPVIGNLTDYIHVLLAGQTGSGKSARLGSILSSLLMQSPDNFKMILIDPKKVEFGRYKNDPHLIGDVVTEGKDAVKRLNYLVNEQENRYRLFEKAGVSNLQEYNAKGAAGELPEGMPTHLPSIGLFIDEFGNLMGTHGKDIEGLVKQLGEKSRAAGVHLVLATQRPTAKNIPTDIRANIPTTIGLNARDWRESGYIGIEGLENLPQKGPLIIKTPDGKTTKADGSFMNGDGISTLVKSSISNEKSVGGTEKSSSEKQTSAEQMVEQQINEIAKTPGAKKGLSAIAGKIGKGDMRPFNVPEGEKADAVKKYLESQGLTYIEKPTGTGKITITPQQKPVESGVSPSGAGTEASTTTSVSTTGTETGVRASVPPKAEGIKPSPEREAERNSVNEDLRDEYDAFHKEFDDSISKSRQGLEQKKASGKAKAMDYETARTQEAAALDTINMWRERNGLPKVTGVDKGGNYILEKTEEIETTTTPESQEEGAAGTATEENPYLDTKELESVPAGFDREELEDNAEALNAAQKQYSQSPKGSPERTKARDTIRKILKRDNALRNRLGMSARGDDGKITKTTEQEKSAPVKGRGISPKDDVKGLSEEGKMRYDAALRRFNTAISSAREGLNSDALDDDQYMEAVKNATDSLNKTRKSLGFEKPVKSDGSFAEVVEEKTETAPEAKTTPVIPKTDAPENEPSAGEEIREEKETETEEIEVPSRTGRRGISKSKMESIKAEATKEPETESTGAVSRADEEGSDLSASGKVTAPRTTAASKTTPTPSETNEVAESTSEESGSEKEAPTPAKAELSPEMQTRLEKARERKSERMLKAKKTPPEEKAEPEPSKTPSTAATPEKKAAEPKKPASDTPKDALTKGMEGLDAETRKAMQSDAGIQALQAKVVKAQAEKGEDSKEYKTAVRMLNTAQKQFAEAYRQSQEENSGVVDVRTTASKQSPKEAPKKDSKKPDQAEKESAKKVETPAPKKTEEKKGPSTPEPKKEEPKKQEPKKETPATPEKPEAEASAPKDDEKETPQAREYRERKEAEEKAKAEESAKKAEERAKRLEEAKQRGGRTLNTQSAQYEEQARKDADTSKSKGFKTLSEMKKPEKVDNKTANDLNRQFAEVAEEMQSLSDKLNTKTETSSLSPKETRQTVGLLESLRKGLEDVVDKTQLGKGNFNFRFLRDPDGKTIGLTITKYRGPDGKMKEVEELKETEEDKNENAPSAKKEESSTSKKSVPETPTLFAGAEKARQEGQAKIESLKKSWEERKSRKTPTKDEALSEGYYWSEEVFDGETEQEKVWQDVFDAALFSMEQQSNG